MNNNNMMNIDPAKLLAALFTMATQTELKNENVEPANPAASVPAPAPAPEPPASDLLGITPDPLRVLDKMSDIIDRISKNFSDAIPACGIVVCDFDKVISSSDPRVPVGSKTTKDQKLQILTELEQPAGKVLVPFAGIPVKALGNSTIIYKGVPRGAVVITHTPDCIKPDKLAYAIERSLFSVLAAVIGTD